VARAYSIANPRLHHTWFFVQGDKQNIVNRFFAMFVGDLIGALIMLYAMKGILALLPTKRPRAPKRKWERASLSERFK
jgi:hypothetical protein